MFNDDHCFLYGFYPVKKGIFLIHAIDKIVYWYHDKRKEGCIMKKNSGELLVELDVVNAQQLAECQQLIEKSGETVEACLIDKKYTTAIASKRIVTNTAM